ncbi:MAG TPA: major capsid protein [Woeseiaceae bacterium]|nr:major capsid protein [Woeseiaceae bacterium]
MLTMDVFKGDAFNAMELTDALEKVPHKPQFLGGLGIFEPRPVRTEVIAIEQREGSLSIVQTTPRGAPLETRSKDPRSIRNFNTSRVAKGDTLHASEIQGIRAFGRVSELEQVQEEVMRRQLALKNDVELTHENMRLGAIQGIVLDADASPIYNYFTEFGITQATEIDFDLDNATPASGAVRKKCNQVVRQMMKAAKGAWSPTTQVAALCGDTFFDDLVAHSEVRETYLNQQAANSLRNDVGMVFDSVRYGNITFYNYRGTDDGTTVAIGDSLAKFFPIGAPGVFQHAMSPGESFDFVNTPGREHYSIIVPDEKRNMFVDIEVYSYPLMVCSRPEMLQRGRRT